jgi:CspA family cold shock protein
MAVGTVRWFDRRKGYGFLATDQGQDVFVHYSGIDQPGFKVLQEGDPVEFDIVPGEKGSTAQHVKVKQD